MDCGRQTSVYRLLLTHLDCTGPADGGFPVLKLGAELIENLGVLVAECALLAFIESEIEEILARANNSKAPKARNVIAWASGPGKRTNKMIGALKARNVPAYFAPSVLGNILDDVIQGRCPWLLHFAPLALGSTRNPVATALGSDRKAKPSLPVVPFPIVSQNCVTSV